ncbi:MAG TPA: hypothetical protein VMU95_02265 [Trebonia sp.]|nr:hypothetical protein [Trebonia sp.]
MNKPPDISQTLDDNDSPLDPRAAAALLEQATEQARRTLTPITPQLWAFRALVVLVAFGSFWLSVRGQHPYAGPTGTSLLVAFPLVAANIVWTTTAIRRAGAGVSGPAQRRRNAWIGIMLVVWIVSYAVTAPLYHAGASHPTWALYPASAPLLFIGVAGAVIGAACRYWRMSVIVGAIGLVAVAAGFGGPVGVWLIMAIGFTAVCLAAAGYIAWQQRHGGVVLP